MSLSDYPLAAFDIESTSVDVTTARIVTASLILINGKKVTTREWLLNPEIEIPQSAIDIHGVTNERAQTEGQDYASGYADILDALDQTWAEGRIVAGMNLAYDMSVLHHEGKRLGRGDYYPGALFDALIVDKHIDRYRKGGRTLTDLAKHYDVEQGEAHTSAGDCYTVARIAYRLVRSPKLAEVDDAETLQQLQRSWRAEQQDSLRAFWQGRGDERWRTVSSDWPVIA